MRGRTREGKKDKYESRKKEERGELGEEEQERETSREILEITSAVCALSCFASLSANSPLIIHRPIIIISCEITSRLSKWHRTIGFLS